MNPMPELPEVETVRRGLESLLKHQPVLERVQLRRPDIRFKIPIKKIRALEGLSVLQVGRRAKYLWFETSKGYLISHLGMTGTWRPFRADEELGAHDHAMLQFSDGLKLVFRDPRRFGILDFTQSLEAEPFSKMGPEPFSESFSAEYLKEKFRSKKTPIKNALMDQRVVVGIGNIYANEILFESRIRPARSSSALSRADLATLVEKSKEVLRRSIEAGGSSLQDFIHTNGQSGKFQDSFFVYSREDEPCRRCKGRIRSRVMAGRNTFWCPSCQQK